MRDGKPYCLNCFDAMFAEYCDFCGEPIGVDQGQMSHDGQHWHATEQCFACSTCRCSLLGRPFLPRRGAIYCSIACSKGEPPTPSDSSGPGLKTPRQKPVTRKVTKPCSDNESSVPPESLSLKAITNNKHFVISPTAQDSASFNDESLQISNIQTLKENPLSTNSAIKDLDRELLEYNSGTSIGNDLNSSSMSHKSAENRQNDKAYSENIQSFDMTDFAAKLSKISPNPSLIQTSEKNQLNFNFISTMNSKIASSMPELIYKHKEPLQRLETSATTPKDVTTSDLSEITRSDSQIILPKPIPIKKEVRFETPDKLQDSLSHNQTERNRHRNINSINNRKNRRNGHHSRHRKYSSEHSKHLHDIKKRNFPSPSTSSHLVEESDVTSICSTCSSSSSSGDEKAYELPARRTYLGSRVSYMPNDALAAARRQKQVHDPSDKDNKNCIIS